MNDIYDGEFEDRWQDHLLALEKYKAIKYMLEFLPDVKKIKINGPATILFFNNGDKSIVKLRDGDMFDAEKGILFACVKYLKKRKANVNSSKFIPGMIKHHDIHM